MASVTKTTRPKTLGAVIAYELNELYTRGQGILLAGSGSARVIGLGTVLAKLLLGTAAVAAGTNTGTGTLTMHATAPLQSGAQSGAYVVRCIGGTFAATAGAVVGTGNGVITMANPAFDGASVKTGVYKVVFVEPATDLGSFVVEDPTGVVVGRGVVGSAYDGPVKFTIADGSQDFTASSYIPITVAAAVPANGGVFQVTAPDGAVLANATVGAAYSNQIAFTIADGTSADFVVGDTFTVTVAATAEKWAACDPSAVNGLHLAEAIAVADARAPDGYDGEIDYLESGPAIVKLDGLTWAGSWTNDQKTAALDRLRAKDIKVVTTG